MAELNEILDNVGEQKFNNMPKKQTLTEQPYNELLSKLSVVHEGIIRHVELIQGRERVVMNEKKNGFKIRWFMLSSILLSFGLIKHEDSDNDYSFCCYKCNQIIVVHTFRMVIKHLQSPHHK